MKQQSIKTHIGAFFDYALALAIIASNYSMLGRDEFFLISEDTWEYLFYILCLLRLVTGFKLKADKSKVFCVVLVFCVCLLATVIPGFNIIKGLVAFCAGMSIFALMVAICSNTKSIWIKFENIMLVIAVLSLFFYLFGTVLGILRPSGVAHFQYAGQIRTCNTYYRLFYEAQSLRGISYLGSNIRNCGIFIEAPMFNVLLCFAFIVEITYRKNIRKSVLVIFVLAILTTWTTTGYLFLIVMVAAKILQAKKGSIWNTAKLMSIPLIGLIAIYVILTILENKITSSASGSASVSVRLDHMIAYLKMFISRPLFGYGYGNQAAFYELATYDQGYSVGLIAFLGRYGIFVFLLYIVPWLRMLLYSLRKGRYLYYCMGSFVCLFLTAVVYQPIMYFVVCGQLMESLDLKRSKGKKRKAIESAGMVV